MDPQAMEPYGAALRAYFAGDTTAKLILCRDDGFKAPIPIRHFFREPFAFTAIENTALQNCRGRVLDVGAGSGLHSLILQEKGPDVTALDLIPQAVEVMAQRGVKDVQRASFFTYEGGPFDTILMLGHGIGMAETVAGLERFFAHARGLLAEGGRVLLDSLDVRTSEDPRHRAYQEANRKAGRYIGEIRMHFEFRGLQGPVCGWLHVDPETLKDRAGQAGWACEVIVGGEGGNYLARLHVGAPRHNTGS